MNRKDTQLLVESWRNLINESSSAIELNSDNCKDFRSLGYRQVRVIKPRGYNNTLMEYLETWCKEKDYRPQIDRLNIVDVVEMLKEDLSIESDVDLLTRLKGLESEEYDVGDGTMGTKLEDYLNSESVPSSIDGLDSLREGFMIVEHKESKKCHILAGDGPLLDNLRIASSDSGALGSLYSLSDCEEALSYLKHPGVEYEDNARF